MIFAHPHFNNSILINPQEIRDGATQIYSNDVYLYFYRSQDYLVNWGLLVSALSRYVGLETLAKKDKKAFREIVTLALDKAARTGCPRLLVDL